MNRTTAVAGVVLTFAALVIHSTGAATAAVPGPITIDFTGESAGNKPDGYTSAESPNVLFSDTLGADLGVGEFGAQSNGLGLEVRNDDASALEIRLGGPTTGISLAFGNDHPGVADVTDQAQLTLYRGAALVDQVSVNVNANDVMDQRISYKGDLFNRATFQYVDAADAPLGLIEVVDDFEVAPLCTVVGTNGNDRLLGTAGRDVICGAAGRDTINAFGADDLIFAGEGDDVVNSHSGGDVVSGGAGRDDLNAGSGGDRFNAGLGRDECDGGKGRDIAASCEVRTRIP